MNIALWTLQSLLAILFFGAGLMKATAPLEKVRAKMHGLADTPPALIRFAGAAELAGAIGLLAPEATGIATFLTPLAALGLGVIMVLAARLHASRGERSHVRINLVLLALTLTVAVGRVVF